MTKEQFLELVGEPEITMAHWHEYFEESSGTKIPYAQFEKVFVAVMSNLAIIKNSKGVLKQLNFKKAVDNFYDYYKRKFELWEYEKADSEKL